MRALASTHRRPFAYRPYHAPRGRSRTQQSTGKRTSISKRFGSTTLEVTKTGITLQPGMNICQQDLPLDWYQPDFKPYAEEYLALRDRTPETVIPWMTR
jgi:hypothetical protein